MSDLALRVENLSNKHFDWVKMFKEHAAEDPILFAVVYKLRPASSEHVL